MIENQNIEVVIDWFQITIFPSHRVKDFGALFPVPYSDGVIIYLFKELFNINFNDLVREPRGLNGYDVRYSYKEISIMNHSQREDMGVNILLTGKGCRDFESLGIGWDLLFNKLKVYEMNFNRIDIAIDTFDNRYFDLELLKKYIKKGSCCSKFINALFIYNNRLEDGSISSNTIQFGSKASDIQITFYDKLLERSNAGYIIDNNIDFWVRTELRFRHDKAQELFYLLCSNSNYSDFIFSILYEYIDFKDLKSKDSNISRRKTADFWFNFIGNNKKLKLSTKSRESDIVTKYNWLLESTSRTQLMVYLSKLHNISLDTISIDLVYKFLTKGIETLKDKDIQLINDYRIKNKLVPLSKKEILDYIQDLKDNILE